MKVPVLGFGLGGIPIDLDEGRYLIEAYLPNGELLAETITVAPGANPPVWLRAEDSPYEWLSWQNLAGRVPKIDPQRAPLRGGTTPVPVSVQTETAPVSMLPTALLERWTGTATSSLPMGPLNVQFVSTYFDRTRALTTCLLDGEQFQSQVSPAELWHADQRYWAVVDPPGVSQTILAALPLPWTEISTYQAAPVDILIDASGSGPVGWPVSISVLPRDSAMAAAFGYLTTGDLPSAADIMEAAVHHLELKLINPLAAAGAAYVLIRGAARTIPAAPVPVVEQAPVWVAWLTNLRHWFPAISDGAVLDGWAHLNGIGRPPDASKAAEAFVEAFQRGIPRYSEGVRLLGEGLTRIARDDASRPKGFDEAYAFVRKLSLHIDARQTFTVVRAPRGGGA
jgi:hypothetical protein